MCTSVGAAQEPPLWPGKHLFISVGGASLTADERAMVAEVRPGGVVLLGPNIQDAAQTRALIHEIKTACGMGTGIADWPLIATDQEGGRINRLKLDNAPAAQEIGARGDAADAAAVGRRYGEACRSWGIGVAFAPVLDVLEENTGSVIGSRAFGHDPAVVTQMGLAFAGGLMGGGVIPVAKHYPGHGAVRQDSHHEPAVLDGDGAQLEKHVQPFRSAAAWGMPGIMVGHIAVPALEPPGHRKRPASLSPVLIRDTLRGKMDYKGVIITDDISMGAVGPERGEATVRALEAGCDAVIVFGNVAQLRAAAAAIEAAVETGRLSRTTLEESARRLDEWQAHIREAGSAAR